MAIDTFLFDIGQVLVRFDFQRFADGIASQCGGAVDPVEGTVKLRTALETGEISRDGFLEDAERLLLYRGSREDFVAAYQGIFTENEAMAKFVEEIAGKYRLCILSNTSALHVEGLWRDFPVFRHFPKKDAIFSDVAECMKPKVGIYETALFDLRLEPENTIYIDDLAANIETGREFGFVSHQYDVEKHGEFEGRLRLSV